MSQLDQGERTTAVTRISTIHSRGEQKSMSVWTACCSSSWMSCRGRRPTRVLLYSAKNSNVSLWLYNDNNSLRHIILQTPKQAAGRVLTHNLIAASSDKIMGHAIYTQCTSLCSNVISRSPAAVVTSAVYIQMWLKVMSGGRFAGI